MDDNTFILLYRKSIDSRVFKNPALWKVWTWCLLKASYKERWVSMKSGKADIEVKILPGQFLYGRLSAAKELQMKPSSVRNRMEKLKNMRNVDIKEDSQYSIVSIVNWVAYQVKEKKEDSKEDNQRTIKGQSKDINNKVNKVNKVNNKEKKIKKKPTFSPPIQSDVEKYFSDNGYKIEAGSKAWNYYDVADWKDSRGNQVKNWKQKVRGVWFKDENKINNVQVINNRNLTRSERNALECQKFLEGRKENG